MFFVMVFTLKQFSGQDGISSKNKGLWGEHLSDVKYTDTLTPSVLVDKLSRFNARYQPVCEVLCIQ